MPEKIFQKEIVSDPELLPEVESFIMDIVLKNNIDEDLYNSIALSVAEAASNSIIHGNKLDEKKTVRITVKIDEEKMIIIFRDQGEGFDPEKIPDPTTPENILKDNGRGIHIMRTYLDGLKYNFTPGGTETILELNFARES